MAPLGAFREICFQGLIGDVLLFAYRIGHVMLGCRMGTPAQNPLKGRPAGPRNGLIRSIGGVPISIQHPLDDLIPLMTGIRILSRRYTGLIPLAIRSS